MTTFTGINPTETQSGKPITESLMTRLANNLIAVLEGDPTAPIIYPAIMPQGSGGLDLATSRTGNNLGSMGGFYYSYLEISYNSGFPSAIDCSISADLSLGGSAGTDHDYKLYIDGSEVAAGSSMPWGLTLSLPSGAHTLTLAARNQFNSGDSYITSTSTLTAKGLWL